LWHRNGDAIFAESHQAQNGRVESGGRRDAAALRCALGRFEPIEGQWLWLKLLELRRYLDARRRSRERPWIELELGKCRMRTGKKSANNHQD
jgi:hypothetical protein